MNKNILVLSPHTDDGEIGCGGTISKHIIEGDNVTYVAFSICEKSVPNNFKNDILLEEVSNATHVLGIKKENIFIYRFEVREFLRDRQQILEELIKLKDVIRNIDIVYSPSSTDIHQDHKVIFEETRRVFRTCTHLGYELPRNNYGFIPSYYSKLTTDNIQIKINALEKYESQQFRIGFSIDQIYQLSIYRGMQIDESYAEAFEVIRVIN